jgi:hypothetical protein
VRGGGTTGQSDALGVGIAKGLVVHNPSLEHPFRTCEYPQCGFAVPVSYYLQRNCQGAIRAWWRERRLVLRRLARGYVAPYAIAKSCSLFRSQYAWVKR